MNTKQLKIGTGGGNVVTMFPFSRALVVLALGGSGWIASAQTGLEPALASEVQLAVASLSSPPELGSWKSSHGKERVDLAHYDTVKDIYEVDFGRAYQLCASSLAEVPPGVTRAASFYVPEVTPGALPPLPLERGSALLAKCRLGAYWYEARGKNVVAGLTKDLTLVWGPPRATTRRELADNLFIRGSGYWRDLATWKRGNVWVWVALTDSDKGDGVGIRTIVSILRDRPRDTDLLSRVGLDTTAAALKMAGMGEALNAEVKTPAKCSALGAGIAAGRLSRWLKEAASLPPERRAAALLVADSFVGCVLAAGDPPEKLAALGLKWRKGCDQFSPSYANNFRQEAQALNPKGAAGALAALAGVQSPCSLPEPGPWPDKVLVAGQRMMRDFAPGPWTPWVSFAVARAHDVKLSFSMPPGEVDAGTIHPLSAAAAREERNAAITGFEQFFRAEPDAPVAVFAWQEAWRLMAGLPPSATHFGCGCE